ncbi:MAG: asparagine synthase (glutamine-hydrolyzing) [Lachnospiraceae bacterium]
MCGIVGLCNWNHKLEENIEIMKHYMYNRGPNANGTWILEDRSIAFGHQRLSIMDLSPNGAQPMMSHSGRFVMVFNGEIYNHQQLSEKLLKEQIVKAFHGSSDTEVLLEAFEAYGIEQTIAMCKGMFAIGLFDTKEKVLYLMRDRIGEKPLFYGMVKESFVFASDLNSISNLQGFDNPIDQDVLNTYFVHGYIPAPHSIYENIFKLEPGKILTIKAPYKKYDIQSYWSMKEVAKHGQQNLFKGSEEEATKELEDKLKAAIKDQMVADVPVGAFLSSGIDSTTIVSLMQSISTNKVKTFTIGVEDVKYNEAKLAKEIANHLGTQHTQMYISEEDAKDVIPEISSIFGEPFADSSQIPTYLVSKLTKQHVTVSLSGDGGDELFCGYRSYQSIDRIWNKMKHIPSPMRGLGSSILEKTPFSKNDIIRTKSLLLKAKNPGHLYQLSCERDPISLKIAKNKKILGFSDLKGAIEEMKDTKSNIMLMDLLMYHPDDILVKVDRSGMAVSLESRIPMLDKDVVEFAWSLPMEYKIQGDVTKKILRNILYKYVPRELVDQPKRGFSIPVAKWLKEPKLREWAEDLIEPSKLERQNLLNVEVVWDIWNRFIKEDIWCNQIWYILMFQEWICKKEGR